MVGVANHPVPSYARPVVSTRPPAAGRERVLAAMQMLGYRPNTAARALATGKFRMLGV
ncbi:LacI family transcriptional regulator, partial [Embleya sp. NPDC005575]